MLSSVAVSGGRAPPAGAGAGYRYYLPRLIRYGISDFALKARGAALTDFYCDRQRTYSEKGYYRREWNVFRKISSCDTYIVEISEKPFRYEAEPFALYKKDKVLRPTIHQQLRNKPLNHVTTQYEFQSHNGIFRSNLIYPTVETPRALHLDRALGSGATNDSRQQRGDHVGGRQLSMLSETRNGWFNLMQVDNPPVVRIEAGSFKSRRKSKKLKGSSFLISSYITKTNTKPLMNETARGCIETKAVFLFSSLNCPTAEACSLATFLAAGSVRGDELLTTVVTGADVLVSGTAYDSNST
ncbi:hypothetical protein EVAR_28234_1 [Eumeta japonica]|uniref:Uncharacterized protein n=1 Tax=Eumeta variegata TaxID=151549 RepID=A0A4C1V6G2_EUMVA|nr:hypothetical protein EVAR_28234_1 [Eumeta japonica]